MKRIFLVLSVLLMVGCAATPIKRTFPSIPEELKSGCGDLRTIDTATDKLSDIITVVVENYGQYHECKIKNDSWLEWYNTQKRIFDSVK
jgi:uncharacterized protein YceK